MTRLRIVRDTYSKDVERLGREVIRAQSKLEAAKLKLSVADEMISKVQQSGNTTGVATFEGLGKYAHSSLSDALLDVINTHAGINGMAVGEVREILLNEGLPNPRNLGVTIHLAADRLAKKGLIRIHQNGDGKRFSKPISLDEPPILTEEKS